MALEITQSVGLNGRNRLHDVALVQLMLRLLYKGSGGGGRYYRGNLTGNMDGPTSGAIRQFFNDIVPTLPEAKQKAIDMRFPRFTPGGPMFAELVSFTQSQSILTNLLAVSGAPVLYYAGNAAKKVRGAADFLIHTSFMLPEKFTVGDETFDARFEEVMLGTGGIDLDRFVVRFSLVGVGTFVDPRSLKVSKTLPSAVLKAVEKAVRGTQWYLASAPQYEGKGQFTLMTRKSTGLRSALGRYTQYGFVPRVIEEKSGAFSIPAIGDVLEVAGRVHALRCASTGEFGSPLLPDIHVPHQTAKTAAGISKAVQLDRPIEHLCRSCASLKDEMDRIHAEQVEKVSQLGENWQKFHRYVKENTRKEQFDKVHAEWEESVAGALLPIDKEAFKGGLLEVDDDDILEHGGEALEQIGRNNAEKALGKTSKVVGKGFGVIEKVEAIYDTIVLLTELPRKILDDKRMAEKIDETHRLNANLWIELQALDVEYRARLRDFETRGCP